MTQNVAGVKFSTLPGFAIERMNPPDKGDSYVVITFDSLGRLVVSKEQDFPRILLDNDKDGIYESEKIISDKIRNCQGLWFEGRTLYAACAMVPTPEQIAAAPPPAPGGGRGGPNINNRAGIFRLEDTNGDDVADTFEILGMAGSIQEHGPHAIRRRPDGGFSVIVGNNETIGDLALDLTSPVLRDKDAQFLPYFANFGQSAREGAHSAIFDWNPAAKKFRIFSGGNRNAYDYGYNLAGEAFLFDSDMEWDIGLPWYREVRTAHQILNGNYGYRNGSGKYPPVLHRLAPADARPRTRVAGGRGVLLELCLPARVLRQSVRGRLVAWPAAVHGPDPRGRDVHDAGRSGRVRPWRTVQHHRRRSRPRRSHVFHDRRTQHDGRTVAAALHGNRAGRARHDGHPRRRASATAALELGLGGDREGQGDDGRQLRRRAREDCAQRIGTGRGPRPRDLRDAAARGGAERRAAVGTHQGRQRRCSRRRHLRGGRAGRGGEGGCRGRAQGPGAGRSPSLG